MQRTLCTGLEMAAAPILLASLWATLQLFRLLDELAALRKPESEPEKDAQKRPRNRATAWLTAKNCGSGSVSSFLPLMSV